MLTSSCYQITSIVYKLAEYLRVIVYKWDTHSLQFIYIPSNYKQICIDIFILIICNLHFNFIVSNCLNTYSASSNDIKLMSKAIQQFCIGYPIGITCYVQLVLFFKKQEFLAMVNNFIKIEQKLTKEFEFDSKKNKNSIGLILWCLAILCCVHIVGLSFFFIAKPNTPIFMYSIFHGHLNKYWVLVWLPIEMFPYVYAWVNALLFVISNLPLLVSARFWILQLAGSIDEEFEYQLFTRNSLRTKKNIILTYRSFQILVNIYNDCMKDITNVGAYTVSLIGMVFGMFGTIEFYDKLDFQSYLMFPTLAIMFTAFYNVAFKLSPMMNDASIEFRSLDYYAIATTFDERKELKWFILSCRDLKIWCGDFFTFEWETIGETMNLAADHTVNLLIGVKEAHLH